jgi:mannosyltransferase
VRRIGAYACAAVLLLAFSLRAYHLGFQASMSDDALGLVLARRNPLELFSFTAAEPFPPTFYVTLSLWTKLAGSGEYAGRFFSLLFSVAAVAVLYRAGRRILGEQAGMIAALLLAISPMDIFFAQEVRMYAMLTLFSLASALLGFELISGRSRAWLGFGVVSLVAVMTHAFALLVLLAETVSAWLVGPRRWRWQRAWAATLLAVLAVFGIWVGLVARNLESYRNALVSAPSLAGGLWRAFSAFALGFSPASGPTLALPAILAGLAATGAGWLAWRRRTLSGAYLLSYLLVPFIAVWVISLVRPAFYERYMVICLPPALLLAAGGIAALARELGRASLARAAGAFLAAASLMTVAVLSGLHLRSYYQTVVYASSDDMRQLAAYVSSVPNSVVITNVPQGDPLYGYYFPPSLPIVSTLDMPAPELAPLLRQHRVAWFLPFGQSDHQQAAYGWLNANAYPAAARWFGNAQVLAFAWPSDAPALQPLQPSVSFGGQIRLAGLAAPAQVAAGEPIDVTLRWEAQAKPAKDYSAFVHLLDAKGATVSQHDGWPAAGARPTSSWQPGDTIDDRHGLLTTPSMPEGAYRLEVGLYDAAGQRLAAGDGASSAIVGTVQVTAPRSAGR